MQVVRGNLQQERNSTVIKEEEELNDPLKMVYRSILWSAHEEEQLHRWLSTNFNVEVHAYVKNGKYCVVNNQRTTVYKGDGTHFELDMENAYENGLAEKIHRRFDIGDDFVKFSDTFTYSDKTESIVERMISQIKPEVSDGCVMIDGTKILFDSERYGVSIDFEDYRNIDDDGEERAYLIDFVPVDKKETEFIFEIKI